MATRNRALAPCLGFVVLATGASCDGCGCNRLGKQYLGTAPEEEVKAEVSRQLPNAAKVAGEMCGIPSSGIEVDEIEIESSRLGMARARVKGKPIAPVSDAGAASDPDAAKALVCAGVVLLSFKAVLNDDDDTVARYDFKDIETYEVGTPGVKFERPSSDWDD
jgi:hypothetical protein